LASAARKLGLAAARVHQWAQNDKDFHELVKLAREVVADKLEEEFMEHGHFIPKMMLLKAYRPMFRENYKIDFEDSRMKEMLENLRQLGQKNAQKPPEEENNN
jgi:hypothetical protein